MSRAFGRARLAVMRSEPKLSIWSLLERSRDRYPDRVALVDGEERYTYAEVYEQVCGLAAFLQGQGVGAGDRLAALMVNSHAYLVTYFAASALGVVLAPLNYRLSSRELGFILKDADAGWVVADAAFSALLAEVGSQGTPIDGVVWVGNSGVSGDAGREDLPSRSYTFAEVLADTHRPGFIPSPTFDDALAHLYYTSGTTGMPKGVMLSHRNVCVHAEGTIAELALHEGDVWGHIAPMFHLADAWATFAITAVGGRHVMSPRFEARTVLATLQDEAVTITNLIPTMLNSLVNHPEVGRFNLGSLRLLLSGGAPIAPALVRRIVALFQCEYVQTYGMTETSPYLTMSLLKPHLRELPPSEQLVYRAKTGRPFYTVSLRVVDDQGQPVTADDAQVGEIQVRGDTVTRGYWNRPLETEAAFRDGWLCTGDLAVVDAEGYVNIVDRKKDMIISGGENIYSTEVENALYLHPAVLEAAVIGVPDEKWGEAVLAAVVLKPGHGATSEELITHCKGHIASYKAPKRVRFLDELPKTGSGKIRKQALREEG